MPKLPFQNCMKNYFMTACLSILSAILVAIIPANGLAQPVATPPYSVATFAVAPTGLSKPDSVTFSSTNVFVGYGNGGAPDGSGGAMSNIIEYDFKGNVINNFSRRPTDRAGDQRSVDVFPRSELPRLDHQAVAGRLDSLPLTDVRPLGA